MASLVKQSSTQLALKFFLTQSSNHITGLTGATPTVTIRKEGGSFATPSGTVTEIANGWYQVAGNATDTGTLGDILLHATAASADPCDVVAACVVAFDPQDAVHFGLSALPNAAAGANGGLPTGDASGKVALQADQAVNVTKVNGTAQTARDIGASVLISAGSGTGQLDVTSGVIKANLAQILGTALTETAGYLAAAFKQFFNIATPASTMDALTLVATATNLTNAPTAGDLTATMKTSVTTAATAATPTAAAVTGNVGGNVVGSVGSVTAAVATTSNIKANTGTQYLTFTMTDSTTHAPKTGLTVASTVSINGGAFGSTANSVTEISSGDYTLTLNAADTNGKTLMFRFTATGADDLNIMVITQP